MIRLIYGHERHLFRRDITTMHRIRAQVFAERLHWDVTVVNGLEKDRFDDLDPLYVLSVNDATGDVRGSLRLLPTTGPNMLRDVFGVLLPDGLVVESPTIWESTRFSMSPEAAAPTGGRRLSFVTGELLAGLVEVGLRAGLSEVVSVFDARMLRILRIAGYPAEVIGTPTRIGQCLTYAGLFEVSEAALANIREAAGIVGSVLEPDSVERCLAA
jgi:acyl homoserine lactone synthase